MAPWTILCDFDGTISVEDVTDALLERFGAPGWRSLEDDWRAGKLSSRLCMQGQIALLDVSRPALDDAIDEFRIDPDFPRFVRRAQRDGHALRVVSDGLDYAIQRILSRHGLGALPVHANHLVQTGPRAWRLESPWSDAACGVDSGTCKCARVRAAQRHTVLVGDGASDFCVAGGADFVFAKHRLIEYCRSQRLRHVPIVGFADAVGLLPALSDGAAEPNFPSLQPGIEP